MSLVEADGMGYISAPSPSPLRWVVMGRCMCVSEVIFVCVSGARAWVYLSARIVRGIVRARELWRERSGPGASFRYVNLQLAPCAAGGGYGTHSDSTGASDTMSFGPGASRSAISVRVAGGPPPVPKPQP